MSREITEHFYLRLVWEKSVLRKNDIESCNQHKTNIVNKKSINKQGNQKKTF